MRIELNAGRLNPFSVMTFGERASRFEQSVDTMKNGFENIRNSVYNMNGGVGVLQEAVDLIGKRIDHDEQQRQNVHTAREKCVEFLEEVKSIDREVANIVRQETKEFCKQYPHLAPQPTEREKSFWGKCWEYLKDAGKAIYNWGKKLIGNVIDWGIKKGKETYDLIMNAAAKTVNWLVEQGKNLYEGIKAVFTFIDQAIDKFIDVSVEFISNLIVNIAEKLEELGEFVFELAVDVVETLIDVAVVIKDFVCEHFLDIVDAVFGLVEVVIGVVNIVAAVAEVVASGGGLTPVAVLQIAGSAIAITKGWDKMWGGICNMTGYEPEGAAKIILRPTTSFETMLNDALPGWHLGDWAGLIGDGISIAADISRIIQKAPEIVVTFVEGMEKVTMTFTIIDMKDVAGVVGDIGMAFLDFMTNFTETDFDNIVSNLLGDIDTSFEAVDTFKDIMDVLH